MTVMNEKRIYDRDGRLGFCHPFEITESGLLPLGILISLFHNFITTSLNFFHNFSTIPSNFQGILFPDNFKERRY